jgi:hypothetical protein
MNNYMKTIISGLKQWVSTQITKSKSDWNQNDSSATNYVKNRTHYSYEKEIVFLPNTNLTEYDMDGVGESAINLPSAIKTGQEYNVIFDGNIYSCVGYTNTNISGSIMLGNMNIVESMIGADFADTGEPFLIVYTSTRAMVANAYVYTPTIDSHTIKITYMGEAVKRIDKKYLPDMDYVNYKQYQNLTDDQMQMARDNIGAGTSDFSGSYTDLTNKPTIYTDVVRYNINQSLTDAQKLKVKANIGIGTFDGTFNSLNGKPSTDTVRYGAQSLSTDQKKQARLNIGASDFSGRYSDLTGAPEYDSSYDRLYTTATHTERITLYDDLDGDTKTTPMASWSPTTWHCDPLGQDGSKTSSTTFGFSNRDDNIVLQAQYMKSNGSVITSQDIQFTGIATPTEDNDAANKSYVDEKLGSIDTALERIIEIQENLIGGVTE